MKFLIIAMTILLTGCVEKSAAQLDKESDLRKQSESIRTQNLERVKVIELSRFLDNENNYRTTYLITDTKTGKEFIGVSGVGIAETGTHLVGRTIVND